MGESAIRVANACAIFNVPILAGYDFYSTDMQAIFLPQVFDANGILHTNGNLYIPAMLDTNGITMKYTEPVTNISNNHRHYMFFSVSTDEKVDAIIRLGGDGVFKLWINGDCVFLGLCEGLDSQFVLYKLPAGNSTFVVELMVNLGRETAFGARISRYQSDVESSERELLLPYLRQYVYRNLHFASEIHSTCFLKEYEFMLFKKDYIDSEYAQPSLALRDESGVLLDSFEISIAEKITLDLSKYREKSYGAFLVFDIVSDCTHHAKHILQISPIGERYTTTTNRTKTLINRNNHVDLSLSFSSEFDNMLKCRRESETVISAFNERRIRGTPRNSYLVNMLDNAQGAYSDYAGRILDFEFDSEIDDTKQCITVHMPRSEEETHPLFIVIVPNNTIYRLREDADLLIYKENLNIHLAEESYIAFISIRGFTLGSYIGERAFFECFNTLIDGLNVNENKVYLAGSSNGAYAVWAIAQAYPHLFAGIFVDGGTPYGGNLCNLNHMPIINLAGEQDPVFQDAYVDPTEYYSITNSNYKSIAIVQGSHYTANLYFYNLMSYFMNWLLQYDNNKIPQQCCFRTENMTHTKFQFGEILAFEDGSTHCQISYDISKEILSIRTENVKALRLNLCERYFHAKMSVYLNGYILCEQIDRLPSKDVFLRLVGGNLEVVKACVREHPHLGFGLCNIFMDKLKIVLPSCRENADLDAAKTLANHFVHPHNQTMVREIDVEYNSLADINLTLDDIEQYNLVIIDINNQNQAITKEMSSRLPITSFENGIFYNKKLIPGKFTYQFICENPLNPLKNILVIGCNDRRLFNRNLFIRNFYIPSYSIGFHRYLNNEALLYDGRCYYAVRSFPDEPMEISLR